MKRSARLIEIRRARNIQDNDVALLGIREMDVSRFTHLGFPKIQFPHILSNDVIVEDLMIRVGGTFDFKQWWSTCDRPLAGGLGHMYWMRIPRVPVYV